MIHNITKLNRDRSKKIISRCLKDSKIQNRYTMSNSGRRRDLKSYKLEQGLPNMIMYSLVKKILKLSQVDIGLIIAYKAHNKSLRN